MFGLFDSGDGKTNQTKAMKEFIDKMLKRSTKYLDMKAPDYKGKRVAPITRYGQNAKMASTHSGKRIMNPADYSGMAAPFMTPQSFAGSAALSGRYSAGPQAAPPPQPLTPMPMQGQAPQMPMQQAPQMPPPSPMMQAQQPLLPRM